MNFIKISSLHRNLITCAQLLTPNAHTLNLSELMNMSREMSFNKLWHYAMCSKPSCLEKKSTGSKVLEFQWDIKLVHHSDISPELSSTSTAILGSDQ